MRRILLLRSARHHQIAAIMKAIEESPGEKSVTLLVQAWSLREFSGFADAGIAVYYGESFSFSRLLLRHYAAMAGKFDEVVIPYNDIFGKGYTAIRLFSALLGPSVVTTVNVNGFIEASGPAALLMYGLFSWAAKAARLLGASAYCVYIAAALILKRGAK